MADTNPATPYLAAAATAELEDWGPLEEATGPEMTTSGLTLWKDGDQEASVWARRAGARRGDTRRGGRPRAPPGARGLRGGGWGSPPMEIPFPPPPPPGGGAFSRPPPESAPSPPGCVLPPPVAAPAVTVTS